MFLGAFADWLAAEVPRILPKSKIGEAFVYASNQWPTLIRYVADGRLTIDNARAEQAIRPLAVGRRNWLQIAGDGGLKSAAVLLSVAATAKRHGINPWVSKRSQIPTLLVRFDAEDVKEFFRYLIDHRPDLFVKDAQDISGHTRGLRQSGHVQIPRSGMGSP